MPESVLASMMDGFPFFEAVLGFMILVYVWETYLDLRQHNKIYRDTEIPAELLEFEEQVKKLKAQAKAKKAEEEAENKKQQKEENDEQEEQEEESPKEETKEEDSKTPEEKFLAARAYNLDKSRFKFVVGAIGQVETMLVLWYNALPWLWNYAGEVIQSYGYTAEHEVTQSLVFLAMAGLFETVVGIPFSLYSTFVIEERHGLNNTTLFTWIKDKILMLFFSAAIGGPLISALLHLIKWGGDYFYIYVWAFMFAFTFIMITIYPTLIQPCFNTVEPLEEGSLRTAIEELASRLDFPLTRLYVIDGSKRSGHSNAYFYGFCRNKRIVLYDTLIEQSTEQEVVAVLGHELGHWQMGHTMKMMIIGQVHLFCTFFLFGQFMYNASLFQAFGFYNTMPTIIGLLLFNYVISPTDHVLQFLMNLLSRKFEFEADAFAVKLGYASDLIQGLFTLHKENKTVAVPDALYSAYHYSHPPLLERLAAIRKGATKVD